MTGNANRHTLTAYAAGIAAMASLFYVVALGGTAVAPRTPAIDAAPSQVTALNE